MSGLAEAKSTAQTAPSRRSRLPAANLTGGVAVMEWVILKLASGDGPTGSVRMAGSAAPAMRELKNDGWRLREGETQPPAVEDDPIGEPA